MFIIIAWKDVLFGPFNSEDDAINYAKSHEMKDDYLVRPIISP